MLHLSGCSIADNRFVDAHDGVLMPEQLELLERLLPLCPNVRAITFEDPRIDEQGRIDRSNEQSLASLRAVVERWQRVPDEARA